jgi:DNA repair exonuclease SbcCD nuclease subunit
VDNYYVDDIIDNTFSTKYLFGHLALNEILLNCSGSRSEKEMFSKLDFKKYDMVLSGHFHTKGQYENILYIGSPFHMSFNDSGPRGVYIFDEGNIEFIEYNGAPKCHILNAESYDESVIKGNNIRLDFYSSLGINEINKILKKVENLNPAYLQVSYKFSKEFTNQSTVDIMNNTMGNKEILLDYIKTSNLSSKINMKTLENIINTLEKE